MHLETAHRIGEQPDALQECMGDQRPAHIELEVAAATGQRYRHIVGHHLTADHHQRFALGRIDLARHDRTAGLVLRNPDLADTRSRPGRQPPDVIGNLVQGHRQHLQAGMRCHDRIAGRECCELVRRAHKRHGMRLRQHLGHQFTKARWRIQAGAHCRAADRQRIQAGQTRGDDAAGLRQLRHIARKLLAERERRGVLQMGAADLDNAGELDLPLAQAVVQCNQRRQQRLRHADRSGQMHCSRNDIVGGLPEVDIVIRMHSAALAARAAEQLRAAIGEHLIEVHVGLGARTALPDREHELVGMLARQNLVGGRDNCQRLVMRQAPKAGVDLRTRAFDLGHRTDQFRGNPFGRDREMLKGTLGLRAPQSPLGHADRAKRIGLTAHLGHHTLPLAGTGWRPDERRSQTRARTCDVVHADRGRHVPKKSAGDGIVEQRVWTSACTNNPPGDLSWLMPTAG